MNWTDLAVVAIIAGIAFFGLYKGFINSLYRLLSYFLSIILAVKLAPVASKLLQGTGVFTGVKDSIFKSLMDKFSGIPEKGAEVTREVILKNLPLPEFLKGNIAEGVTPNMDIAKVIEPVSEQLAILAMDILGVILVFIVIKIGLSFFGAVLKGLSNLPVIKQVDRLGGFVFGATAGLLLVYIVFAVLMLFNSSQNFEPVFKAVDESLIAKFFYEKNFIISWLFPNNPPV